MTANSLYCGTKKAKNIKIKRCFSQYFSSQDHWAFSAYFVELARNLLPMRGGAEEEIFDSLRKVQIKIVVKQITSRSIFGSPNSPLHSKNNNPVKFQNFLLPSPLSLSPFFEIISFLRCCYFLLRKSQKQKLSCVLLTPGWKIGTGFWQR